MSIIYRLKQSVPCSLLFLAACSSMPEQPDYSSRVDQDIQEVTTWSQPSNAQAKSYLNELINSEELNTLLVAALEANPNLQQTLLTLKIRRAQTRQTRANQ